MTTRLQSTNSVSATSTSSHHDPAAVTALKSLKSRVEIRLRKYRGLNNTATRRREEYASDFARLARRLCGKSVGVVLGGGGARGLAHLVGQLSLSCARFSTGFRANSVYLLILFRVLFGLWRSIISLLII